MKHTITPILFVSLATLVTGCASARMQRETNNTGHIQISGHQSVGKEEGYKQAKRLMLEKCPRGYIVVGKGVENSGNMTADKISGALTADEVAFIDFKCK